ncbi:nucleotidyltransferase domain-containing protein [Roseibium sp. RKSG952]|uniref:DNA polymerase beta superfamily protein n=1 Tax=Roseibium sp. RKSG952 TaxID=2529384 RepID=UPI001AD94776|nr:nucleotidyltransferase domain-containing protein [Roseibium sp. RKSG952]
MKDDLKLAIARENEVLRGLIGSEAHGTNIPGKGDRDELGIYVEPKPQALGLSTFDHHVYRSVGNHNSPSRTGDLDLTYHSARKFLRLCAGGNPTMLLLLWLPEYLSKTEAGELMVQNRDLFTTRRAGRSFRGFMGKVLREMPRDDDLGYHPKSAMHALRLGIQGRALLETGVMPVPLKDSDRKWLTDVRLGLYSLAEISNMVEEAESAIKNVIETYAGPEQVDLSAVNSLFVDVHEAHWDSVPAPVNRWCS